MKGLPVEWRHVKLEQSVSYLRQLGVGGVDVALEQGPDARVGQRLALFDLLHRCR